MEQLGRLLQAAVAFHDLFGQPPVEEYWMWTYTTSKSYIAELLR